jgi:pimeloyl-ACP methyl ester carboxylesterase
VEDVFRHPNFGCGRNYHDCNLAQTLGLLQEEMMIPAFDPGIELYMRNAHPSEMASFQSKRTVLYVHGATYPSSTTFDLKLDGLSWMEYIASRGYDVYSIDLRGYGHCAYRVVTRKQAMQRWYTGVPEAKKATLIPAGWFDAWADATWKTDPEGAKSDPPVIRAPNGVVADSAEYFGAGKPYFDPAKILVPTLLIGAEWDRDAPPYMAQTLFPLLINAPANAM